MLRPFQAEDLYLLRQVTDCELHPDGDLVAYVVTWCDKETDSNRNQIWLHEGDASRPLTYAHTAFAPRFSPDGSWLAYLSGAHQSPPHLCLLNLGGGEALQLTKFDDGCDELAWLPDSSGLVLVAKTRPEVDRGKTREELTKAPRPRVIESTQYRFNGRGFVNDRRLQVYTVALPAAGDDPAAPVQITDGPSDSFGAKPSPDGHRIAFISARHDDREWVGGNDVWVVEGDGEPRCLTNGGSWTSLAWINDREVVASGFRQRGTVRLSSLHVLQADGSAEPRLLGDGEVSHAGRLQVRGNSVFALGAARGANHVFRYDLATGERDVVAEGRRQVTSFDVSSDATRFVIVATGSNTPAELCDIFGGNERQLTSHTAPFLAEVELADVEDVECTSADGYPVHALLCRPTRPSDEPGAALVYVHGGPMSQYAYGFFDEFQIAAASGYVVIGANPRGSDGYGQAHADSIVGDLGKLDWLDVQATADAVAHRDDVDETRVGIGGGSYGGFMTAWATGHTRRFKAALVERAVTNWVTMESTSDIGWFGGTNTQADTLSNIESLRRQSPITYARNVTTPTLVLHSDEDWRCPPEQGEQWYAVLRRKGVDVSYVRFPGENHELTRSGRPTFRIARFELVHNFYARHLQPGVT
jgi:dipeptidyl aminopeptidase/acylaminoacyl peptidase